MPSAATPMDLVVIKSILSELRQRNTKTIGYTYIRILRKRDTNKLFFFCKIEIDFRHGKQTYGYWGG